MRDLEKRLFPLLLGLLLCCACEGIYAFFQGIRHSGRLGDGSL